MRIDCRLYERRPANCGEHILKYIFLSLLRDEAFFTQTEVYLIFQKHLWKIFYFFLFFYRYHFLSFELLLSTTYIIKFRF